MDKDYIIFQEDGLLGAKNQKGEVVIPPQYMEMQPFSCGLSLVRNHQYQYAYIDTLNRQIVPFGKYSWCDPQFTCGYARVMEYHYLEEKNQWGIIDTLGNIIVPLKYDKVTIYNNTLMAKIGVILSTKLLVPTNSWYYETYRVSVDFRLVGSLPHRDELYPLSRTTSMALGASFSL